MKTLIIILITVSFVQSTILPINLVLIILLCRAYLRTDNTNLYLAFGFGLLNAHLNLQSLGFISLIYLSLVELTQVISKSNFSGNPLLIIPISFLGLSINDSLISLYNHQSILLFPKIFSESFVSLPIFYLVRIWEERFIVKGDIKLKF